MSAPEKRLLVGISLLALIWALGHAAVGLGTDTMFLAPALVLLLPLLAGRYVGERRLLSLVRARPPVRRARLSSRRPRACHEPLLARGGLLIAASLAVRPPPLAAS